MIDKNNIKEEVKFFVSNIKNGKADISYDICVYLLENNHFNTGLLCLLIFKELIPKSKVEYQKHIYDLIEKLFCKKYPFLIFRNTIEQRYDDSLDVVDFINFGIDYRAIETDVFENLSSQNTWIYFKAYREMLIYYNSGKISEKSLSNCNRGENVLSVEAVIKKRIKKYWLTSAIKFGGNQGRTIGELIDLDPGIIANYIVGLSHFSLFLGFWLDYKIVKKFGASYFDLFEKNLLKMIVEAKQTDVLEEINRIQQRLYEENKQLNKDFLSDYNRDDDESRIMRGLSEGNGDQFGF